MAIQVRLASATAGLSSPVSISSAGIQAGDLVLLHVRTSSSGPATPSGFTLVPGSNIAPTNSIQVYQRIATGSEPATYDVTFASGTARLGLLVLYSDTGKALVLDGVANQANSSSTNFVCPSITTTIAAALLCCFVSLNNAVTTTAPGSMTKQYDTGGTSTIGAFTETLGAAGATGTRTPTGSGAQSSRTVSLAYAEQAGANGAADITLDDITAAAAGTVDIAGAAAITLGAVTLEAADEALPNAPSTLTATAISASKINLAWTHDGLNLDGFSVERSSNGVSGWAEIGTVAAAVRSYSDTGLAANTRFYYRVRAYKT